MNNSYKAQPFGAIVTKFHGATNTKPSRITAGYPGGSEGKVERLTISYQHEFNADENHALAVRAMCDKMNWKGDWVGGWTPTGYYWVRISVHEHDPI